MFKLRIKLIQAKFKKEIRKVSFLLSLKVHNEHSEIKFLMKTIIQYLHVLVLFINYVFEV